MPQLPLARKTKYTIPESARALGMKSAKLRELIRSGCIPAETIFRPMRLVIDRQVLVTCVANTRRRLQDIPEAIRDEVARVRKRESQARRKLYEEGLLDYAALPVHLRDRPGRRKRRSGG